MGYGALPPPTRKEKWMMVAFIGSIIGFFVFAITHPQIVEDAIFNALRM